MYLEQRIAEMEKLNRSGSKPPPPLARANHGDRHGVPLRDLILIPN